jgi:hypothetical protein
MSQPAAPASDPTPAPAVPYGPGPGEPGEATPAARSVGQTAVKWGLRLVLAILIRAVFRALSRR